MRSLVILIVCKCMMYIVCTYSISTFAPRAVSTSSCPRVSPCIPRCLAAVDSASSSSCLSATSPFPGICKLSTDLRLPLDALPPPVKRFINDDRPISRTELTFTLHFPTGGKRLLRLPRNYRWDHGINRSIYRVPVLTKETHENTHERKVFARSENSVVSVPLLWEKRNRLFQLRFLLICRINWSIIVKTLSRFIDIRTFLFSLFEYCSTMPLQLIQRSILNIKHFFFVKNFYTDITIGLLNEECESCLHCKFLIESSTLVNFTW